MQDEQTSYPRKDRRKHVLTDKEKSELVEAITINLLERAPTAMWDELSKATGKGILGLAFKAMRTGFFIGLAYAYGKGYLKWPPQ